MASFSPGTSPLKAESYEGAFVEATQILRLNLKPLALARVGIEIEEDATIISCSIQLPLIITLETTGSMQIQAKDETIAEFNWSPDPNSDASASNLAGQILAIAYTLNEGVRIDSGDIDRCQMSISTDTKTAVIVARFLLYDRPIIPVLTLGVAPYIEDLVR